MRQATRKMHELIVDKNVNVEAVFALVEALFVMPCRRALESGSVEGQCYKAMGK